MVMEKEEEKDVPPHGGCIDSRTDVGVPCGAILADEMGLGKTLMTISIILALYRHNRLQVRNMGFFKQVFHNRYVCLMTFPLGSTMF